MFKLIKVGVYFTALGTLAYFVTPELFHEMSKQLNDAGANILAGIRTAVGQYVKDKAVEGIKELPNTLYKDFTSIDPNFKGR